MLSRCCSRKRIGLALLLSIVLMLSGCSVRSENETMPFIQPVYPPLQHHLRATLYFAKPDGNLSPEIRLIDLDQSISAENGLVRQLIAGPAGGLLPIISNTTALNYVYIVEDTAYIDLSLVKQQQLAQFSSACIQSLHDAFNVSYLVMSVDGNTANNSFGGVVSATPQRDTTTAYVQLFFPDKRGQYIIPVVRHISKPAVGNEAKAILDALQDGSIRTDLLTAMDNDGVVLSSLNQTGSRLDVYLQTEQNRISLYGYACLAMSLLRNVPKVEEVRINVNGDWVRDVPGLAGEGSFNIASLEDILGGLINLYFAGADGKNLVKVPRSVSFKDAADPLTAVKEIIRGPLDVEKAGILNVLPAGVKTSDILTLHRNEDLAILDLKSTFYQAGSTSKEEAEKLLLYAIVNALTERADIQSVLFLNNGANVETLSGTISLYKPLLRNPGLVLQP